MPKSKRPTRRAAAASQRVAHLTDRRAQLAAELRAHDEALSEARKELQVEDGLAEQAEVYAEAHGLPLDVARDELAARKREAADAVAKSTDAMQMTRQEFRDHLARKGIAW